MGDCLIDLERYSEALQIKSKTVQLLVEALESQAHVKQPPRTGLPKGAGSLRNSTPLFFYDSNQILKMF